MNLDEIEFIDKKKLIEMLENQIRSYKVAKESAKQNDDLSEALDYEHAIYYTENILLAVKTDLYDVPVSKIFIGVGEIN